MHDGKCTFCCRNLPNKIWDEILYAKRCSQCCNKKVFWNLIAINVINLGDLPSRLTKINDNYGFEKTAHPVFVLLLLSAFPYCFCHLTSIVGKFSIKSGELKYKNHPTMSQSKAEGSSHSTPQLSSSSSPYSLKSRSEYIAECKSRWNLFAYICFSIKIVWNYVLVMLLHLQTTFRSAMNHRSTKKWRKSAKEHLGEFELDLLRKSLEISCFSLQQRGLQSPIENWQQIRGAEASSHGERERRRELKKIPSNCIT